MSENNYPQLCFEVGLNCEDCTSASARQVAKVCQGLRGKMVAQLFIQLYPDPACSRMHAHFAVAYKEAAQDLCEVVPRKGAAQEALPPCTMAAVA